MSIVFLSPTGQSGGAEAALHELVASLRESHPSWRLNLIVASDGPLVERVRAIGVAVQILPFPSALARLGDWGLGKGFLPLAILLARCVRASWPAWSYVRALRAALHRLTPDVVHTNGLKMHLLGAWARPQGAAVLWHIHDYVGRRPLISRLLRRNVGRCSSIVANSTSVAEDFRRVCGDVPEVHAVWNAVDLSRFSPNGAVVDLDRLAGLPADASALRVGLVATFARWKGHSTFLEALALLPRDLQIRGYVIGGPVYQTAGSQVSLEELREHAAALGLGSRVGFTGFISDSAAAMRSLDIVVHASTDPEPFGLVIAEGMACAKPVVVSGSGGAAEIAESGANALVHQPGNANELSQCIAQLARDAGLRARLGERGRHVAEQRFTRRRVAQEFTPIYEAAANSPRVSAR